MAALFAVGLIFLTITILGEPEKVRLAALPFTFFAAMLLIYTIAAILNAVFMENRKDALNFLLSLIIIGILIFVEFQLWEKI